MQRPSFFPGRLITGYDAPLSVLFVAIGDIVVCLSFLLCMQECWMSELTVEFGRSLKKKIMLSPTPILLLFGSSL